MHKLVIFLSLLAFSAAQDKNLVELAKELGATSLVSFLEQAGLNDTIATGGTFTVFGPNNDAFAALPADLVEKLNNNKTLLQETLKYHVVSGKVMSTDLKNDVLVDSLSTGNKIRTNIYGSVVTATGSKVILADQEATNGVIHVVEKVMLAPTGNIVDYVKEESTLSTLLSAVTTAELADLLSGDGPFTLFAPNNDAFAKIAKADLDALLADKPKLISVLKTHVIPATYFSNGLTNGQSLDTAETGQKLAVKIENGAVSVSGAKVVMADEAVTNGVIHYIDTVIMEGTVSSSATFTSSLVLLFTSMLVALYNL